MRLRSFRPRLEPLDNRCLPSFAISGPYAVGNDPQQILNADFNGDGVLDLATASGEEPSVSVLLGTGDGTFGTAIPITAYAQQSLRAGDFNGDGNADLATVWSRYDGLPMWLYGFVDVYLSNGDGSFQPAVTVYESDATLTSGPVAIEVADVNGDGRTDIGVHGLYAWAYPYDEYLSWDPYFAVLLGNPDGSFTTTTGAPADFPLPPARDFNRDGYGDLVAVVSGSVSVRLGLPDGTFAPETLYQTGQNPSAVTVGDFNDDGWTDVAVANTGSDDVWLLLNDRINPPSGTPSIQISDATAAEGHSGTRSTTFTVSLSAASSETITVLFATANGTATSSDFVATNGTVSFAPGETTKTITVLVKGDRVGEFNESLFVNLSNATNATIADTQGVGTIIDDEPHISINDVWKLEGRKNQKTLFTFTVTLSVAYDQPLTVSFRTQDASATTSDSDYIAKSGTLTFKPGETTKTITINVIGDNRHEPGGNEWFYLELFGNSSNSFIDRSLGLGGIYDYD